MRRRADLRARHALLGEGGGHRARGGRGDAEPAAEGCGEFGVGEGGVHERSDVRGGGGAAGGVRERGVGDEGGGGGGGVEDGGADGAEEPRCGAGDEGAVELQLRSYGGRG